MSSLNRQPPRVPMVDPKTGLITREWDRFFSDTFIRLGGIEAPTITELDISMPEDSGVAELEMFARSIDNEFSQLPAHVHPLPDDLTQTPVQVLMVEVEALQMQIRDMGEQIAVLMAQINEVKQGTML